MAGITETHTGGRLLQIRQIHSFRASVRKREEESHSPLSLALIDSYLWSIRKLVTSETPISRRVKKEKLEELLGLCKLGHEHVQKLQRAAMEIPVLAAPGDNLSVESLAHLLAHEDSRLRRNACKAIGLIGGEEARRILGSLATEDDINMRAAASEALQYCEIQQLTSDVESTRWQVLQQCQGEIERLHTLLSAPCTPRVILFSCTAVAVALLSGALFSLYVHGFTFCSHGPGFFLGLALFCSALSVEGLLGLAMLVCCHRFVAAGSIDYVRKIQEERLGEG
jgi:hypothetical protein